MLPLNLSYTDSFYSLVDLLSAEGKTLAEIEIVHADPADVTRGLRPWIAHPDVWQVLQLVGIPFHPPYAAAEVVVGPDWCAANSEWGAPDWVLAKRDNRLVAAVREDGCELMRWSTAPEIEAPSPPLETTEEVVTEAQSTIDAEKARELARERAYDVKMLFFEETEGTGARSGPMSIATFQTQIRSSEPPRTLPVDDFLRRPKSRPKRSK
jgi:hypothetical protein